MGREAGVLGTVFAVGKSGVGANCREGERLSSEAQREGSTFSGLVTLKGRAIWG